MKIDRFALCFLCALSFSTVYSQNKPNYKFGLTGGLSAAQIGTPSLKTATELLWHYTTGVTLQQRFSEELTLAYELKYALQGALNQPFGYDFITTKSSYLSLPIIGQFQPKGKPVFVELGGQIGYFLSGQTYLTSHKDQASPVQNVNKLDAGLLAGLGYRLSQHLVIDARYYHGMKTIYKTYKTVDPTVGVPTLIDPIHQYNRSYTLNLSYYF